MTNLSPATVMVLLMLASAATLLQAQTCGSPQLLCAGEGNEMLSTSAGTALTLPPSFCIDDAVNAVFMQFETLDTDQFPNLAYDDSFATLSIGNLLCDPDTTAGQGLDVAVFSASNACSFSTFDDPVFCDTNIMAGQQINMIGLEPATVYYVLVAGSFGDPPLDSPGDCNFSASISGPAVTYDIDAEFVVEGSENRMPNIVFDGETVVLSANEDLGGYTWTGEALNQNSGASVTANPEGIDNEFTYEVETEINGCTLTDQVTFTIRPAIVPFNSFTPNGDTFNDFWEIRNITNWKNAQVSVFSRWGQKVFQATNYQNDWDGSDLPEATYYYVIELNPVDFNIAPYTGSVTILR